MFENNIPSAVGWKNNEGSLSLNINTSTNLNMFIFILLYQLYYLL